MLGKILKYDFKAQFKSLAPVYLIAFGLAIAVRLLDLLTDSFPILTSVYGFIIAMAIAALIGVAVWTAVVSIKHFYTNLLCDEGYLSNTLPVTRNQLILSKEIMIIVTMIMGTIVITACIATAFYHGGIKDFFDMINLEMTLQGVSGTSFLLWMVIMLVVSYVSFIQMAFASLMLGQTKNNNKIMFAIVFGIVIYCIHSIIGAISIWVDAKMFPDIMSFIIDDTNITIGSMYNYIVLIFTTTLIITVVFMVIMHVLSVYLANHKLNLE